MQNFPVMNFSRYKGLDAVRVLCSFGVVFLHVYVAAGSPASLDLLIKLRDFALPVMVLTSFFLLSKSLMRRRESGASSFFSRRVERLWLPLIVWTFFYCSALTFIFPLLLGSATRPEFPTPLVFLTGYRHLWYLQFAFIASAIVYLLFTAVAKLRISETKLAAGCFAASVVYGILYYALVKDFAVWDKYESEFDNGFRIFISQASYYVVYVPAAVGFALIADKLKEWSARPAARRFLFGIVLVAAAAHVGTNEFVKTREIYSLVVFLLALQPWAHIPFGFVTTLAKYSYGIYILHFLPAQMVEIFLGWSYFEPNAANVLGLTIIIYLISFGAAFLIRKLFHAAWLLPLAGGGAVEENGDRMTIVNIRLSSTTRA
jgi:peptidoglycan/LPS O-acetylase OafA/YrhL